MIRKFVICPFHGHSVPVLRSHESRDHLDVIGTDEEIWFGCKSTTSVAIMFFRKPPWKGRLKKLEEAQDGREHCYFR